MKNFFTKHLVIIILFMYIDAHYNFYFIFLSFLLLTIYTSVLYICTIHLYYTSVLYIFSCIFYPKNLIKRRRKKIIPTSPLVIVKNISFLVFLKVFLLITFYCIHSMFLYSFIITLNNFREQKISKNKTFLYI